MWSCCPAVAADALAAAVTALVGAGYARGVRRAWAAAGPGRVVRTGEAASFAAGLVALAVALGPLDASADTSLTAHMAQHVVLLVVAAPLLALGAPLSALLWALPERRRLGLRPVGRRLERSRSRHGLRWMTVAIVLQGAAMWLWHAPGLYDAALGAPTLHGLEHLCYLATAVLFWWSLAGAGHRTRMGAGLVVLFVAALPGTALGVALALAGRPWYPVYARGDAAGALADQQMAGVVMWAVAGAAYVIGAAGLVVAWLSAVERLSPARPPGTLEGSVSR